MHNIFIKKVCKRIVMGIIILGTCINFTSCSYKDKKQVVQANENKKVPPISSIPNKAIYLYPKIDNITYPITDNIVVLHVGDKVKEYHNWNFMTPIGILPEMQTSDYDGDSKDELSVILHVGSGSGVSVDELHIIKISEDEMLSKDSPDKISNTPNPEYFKDYIFDSKDYRTQVDKSISSKTFIEGDKLMLNIKVGGKSYDVNLKDYTATDYGNINDNVYYGDITNFCVMDKKITVNFGIGIITKACPSPLYIGTLNAVVNYKDGKFTLDNFYFNENTN